MSERKVICWDLDGTLGQFYSVAVDLGLINEPELKRRFPLGIRFGIKPLLESLMLRGFSNVVTTSADLYYAEEALRRTGLNECFEKVYDGNIVHFDFTKDKFYQPVASYYEMSEDEAVRDMLIIGDSPGDRPGDLLNAVFIFDIQAYRHDATRLGVLIDRFLAEGYGSFRQGFDALYKHPLAKKVRNYRDLTLTGGLTVCLQYDMNSYFDGDNPEKLLPTAFLDTSELFWRELQLP